MRKVRHAKTGCWIYMGARNKAGYGQSTGGIVSRTMWELLNGPINDRLKFVAHTCDCPPCCNPEHLWLATPKENTEDCIEKGRWGIQETTWKGARLEKLKMLRQQGFGYKLIGREFGLCSRTIADALKKHAPELHGRLDAYSHRDEKPL